MSRIVVQKNETEFRLFCNTVDQWKSPAMTMEKLIKFMQKRDEFNPDLKGHKNALEWIENYCTDEDEFYSYEDCEKSHILQTSED